MPAPQPFDQGLTIKELTAADALVEGCSIREAALRANVTERTIWRYRQKPLFKSYVFSRMSARIDTSASTNVSALPEVMTMLKNIACAPMTNTAVSNSDRIAAARTLLAGAAAYQDRKALENQILELESRLLRLAEAFPAEAQSVSWEHSANPEPGEEEEDMESLAHRVLAETPEEE